MKIKIFFTSTLTAFLFFGVFLNYSSAKVIETINISRRTPPSPPSIPQIPNPPTPPTKPEPSDPPAPPCPGNDCYTPTPQLTPTPTPTPTSSTNDNDVCRNLPGIQLSVPAPYHLDASGLNCVEFGDPGTDTSSGAVGGASVDGQVLGAASMAGTGTVQDTIFGLIFIVGCLATSFGLRKIY